METFTISTIITTIGTMVTGFLGFVGQTAEAITSNPLLLFTCLVPFATVGITVVKKLMNLRA